jgi:predicted nucleic acid-binding Zn ribbon protein
MNRQYIRILRLPTLDLHCSKCGKVAFSLVFRTNDNDNGMCRECGLRND